MKFLVNEGLSFNFLESANSFLQLIVPVESDFFHEFPLSFFFQRLHSDFISIHVRYIVLVAKIAYPPVFKARSISSNTLMSKWPSAKIPEAVTASNALWNLLGKCSWFTKEQFFQLSINSLFLGFLSMPWLASTPTICLNPYSFKYLPTSPVPHPISKIAASSTDEVSNIPWLAQRIFGDHAIQLLGRVTRS